MENQLIIHVRKNYVEIYDYVVYPPEKPEENDIIFTVKPGEEKKFAGEHLFITSHCGDVIYRSGRFFIIGFWTPEMEKKYGKPVSEIAGKYSPVDEATMNLCRIFGKTAVEAALRKITE